LFGTEFTFGGLLTAIAAFGLVLAVWGIVLLLWSRRGQRKEAEIKRRLGLDPSEGGPSRTLRLWYEGEEATKLVQGRVESPPFFERLEGTRKDMGFETPVKLLLFEAFLVVVVAGVVAGVLTERLVPALTIGGFTLVVITWYAGSRLAERKALFERQLVDGLELSARALRAGHPLLSAFRLISEEVPPPVGRIFAEICQQQAMGVSLDDALNRAAALTRDEDMKLFSTSLAIHLRTGGNLAEVVHGLATVIRARMRLNRRFRVLIAQTQLSKRVLLGMPPTVLAVIAWINPEYANKLFDNWAGNAMLAFAAFSLFLGWLVMNRMASLRA
jgi:tight adherence protein B